MTRVLVTGATGFIGRRAVAALEAAGHDVHAVARPAVDLLAPGAAEALVSEAEATDLLHLAWYAEPGAFWRSPENVRWVEASLALLRAFADAGGRRATLVGTCAEYDWAHGFCSEGVTPLAPATLYGRSKHGLHTVASGLAAERGLSLAWARVFFLYGPGEHPARLVATLVSRLLRGEPAEISEGTQLRDFLHVDDVAGALVAIAGSGVEGAVNVGSGVPVAVRDLAATVGELTGRADLIRYGAVPTAPGDPPLIVADTRRLAGEAGFTPRFGLRDGLEDTIARWVA